MFLNWVFITQSKFSPSVREAIQNSTTQVSFEGRYKIKTNIQSGRVLKGSKFVHVMDSLCIYVNSFYKLYDAILGEDFHPLLRTQSEKLRVLRVGVEVLCDKWGRLSLIYRDTLPELHAYKHV